MPDQFATPHLPEELAIKPRLSRFVQRTQLAGSQPQGVATDTRLSLKAQKRTRNFLANKLALLTVVAAVISYVTPFHSIGYCHADEGTGGVQKQVDGAEHTKPVQVYIMLGQSNMLGFGRVGPKETVGSLEYLVKEKQKYPHLLDVAGNWITRPDVRYVHVMDKRGVDFKKLDEFQTVRNEWLTPKGSFGPELGFGHVVGEYHDQPVLLLKACIGNRSLGWDLLPPGSERFQFEGKIYAGYKDVANFWDVGSDPKPVPWYAGRQYDADTKHAKLVLENLADYFPGYKGQGYEIAGFVWWQGHKDQNAALAGRYEQNLVHLIKTLRADFDAPDAKFVLATGCGNPGRQGFGLQIAEAQLAVDGGGGKYPEFAGNVAAVDVRDWWPEPDVSPANQGHHYHHNAETYYEVGHALGMSMIKLLRKPKNDQPNIVLILADDLGYGDLSCYNDQAKVVTPHIDRLASEGIRLTDAHSPSTVCTPTRYGLLTGQMPFRIPRGGMVFTGVGGPSLIESGRLTLATMLRERGYSTACIGKWHVGMTFFDEHGNPVKDAGVESIAQVDFSRHIAGGPIDHGFEHFYGTACCPTTDWLYAFIEQDRVPNPPTKRIDKSLLPRHPYANDCRPGWIADDFPMEEVDLVFLAKSRQFIEDHVSSTPDKPFFLFHSTQAVHLPSFPSPNYKGKTKAGPHGDFIHQLDDVVGQLMKSLTDNGLADNTIVIFTSDNGPETTSVIHMRQDFNHDGARPWRGVKRDNWEGGHRVPMIVRWPKRFPAGTDIAQPTCLTDIVATIAAILNVELPDDAAEDSFDMLPAWQGETSETIRPYLIHQAFSGAKTLAVRRGQWKYIDHPGSGGNRYENSESLKPYIIPETHPDAPGQLYNLEDDPGETTNLYSQHPKVVAELRALLESSKANGRSRP